MPYICCDGNRYIGEHSCSHHHYGDMKLVRPCCVEDARKQKALTLRNAITTSHPAYRMFQDAWNCLTDAERWQVGDIRHVYDHGPAGFEEYDMQAELEV